MDTPLKMAVKNFSLTNPQRIIVSKGGKCPSVNRKRGKEENPPTLQRDSVSHPSGNEPKVPVLSFLMVEGFGGEFLKDESLTASVPSARV